MRGKSQALPLMGFEPGALIVYGLRPTYRLGDGLRQRKLGAHDEEGGGEGRRQVAAVLAVRRRVVAQVGALRLGAHPVVVAPEVAAAVLAGGVVHCGQKQKLHLMGGRHSSNDCSILQAREGLHRDDVQASKSAKPVQPS